jgi:hypothetical protein
MANLQSEISTGTEKWLESESAQLLADEKTTTLMLRIGLARNSLATQLTFAEKSHGQAGYSATELRDSLCSQVFVAALTFEATGLASKNLPLLTKLVLATADPSKPNELDDLVRRVDDLCKGKDPASNFLMRARNKLGFHWDEKPIRNALKQHVAARPRVIFAEFDSKGRPVYRLAIDVLAKALFPQLQPGSEAEEVERIQTDIMRAVELLREFFERALLGFFKQFPAPQTVSTAVSNQGSNPSPTS